MIDWITFEVHGVLHRPISAGALLALRDDDGEIEWQTRRRKSVEGSASSTVTVLSRGIGDDGFATSLTFSGNPSKFLQGHNLYGSDDLPGLVYQVAAELMVAELHRRAALRGEQADPCEQHAMLFALARAVAAHPKPRDPMRVYSETSRGSMVRPSATLSGQPAHDVDSPHVSLSRVDVNYMADLGTDHDVSSWIEHARKFATFALRGARLDRKRQGTSVYFASEKTRRARLKFYAKGPEFAANGPIALPNVADEQQAPAYQQRALLADCAQGKLRAELGLGRVVLAEMGLRFAADWTTLTARQTWLAIMEKFDMPTPADTLDTSALPKNLAFALLAWRNGEDLQARYSRPQWYRIRGELRALTGIDIKEPCVDPRPLELATPQLPAKCWPRNVAELFPADDEPAPARLVAAGLYFEPRTDWRIEHRPAPTFPPRPTPAYCPWPRDPADHRAVA